MLRAIILFTVNFSHLHYNVIHPAWMRGNFGLKLQSSLKLPRIHDDCNECNRERDFWWSVALHNAFVRLFVLKNVRSKADRTRLKNLYKQGHFSAFRANFFIGRSSITVIFIHSNNDSFVENRTKS